MKSNRLFPLLLSLIILEFPFPLATAPFRQCLFISLVR